MVKAHQMMGFNANYVPGWDCHGLPIEWKVEEEFRGKGRSKDEVPGAEFRTRCREYAADWLDVQRSEFKRLGVIGDWDNPYKTMEFASEAVICGELLKIAGSGSTLSRLQTHYVEPGRTHRSSRSRSGICGQARQHRFMLSFLFGKFSIFHTHPRKIARLLILFQADMLVVQ